jgi:hypothetical protein
VPVLVKCWFLIDIATEDLRHGIIHTGAISSLFNVVDNSDESVIHSDILGKLAEYGKFVLFSCI